MNRCRNRLSDFKEQKNAWFSCVLIITILGSLSLLNTNSAFAQEDVVKAIQELNGYFDQRRSTRYILPNLKQGDRLYVYMQGTSGNLDSFIALWGDDTDPSITDVVIPRLESEVAAGRDPIIVLEEISDDLFLRWDDDSGVGYDAAFEYFIPEDGTYQLLASGTPAKDTFGDFRLLVGVNAPDVLSGNAISTGDTLAILNRSASRVNVDIQEVTGTLTQERNERTYTIQQIDAEDTLYVHLEAITGDLRPVVVLEDFGGKPLRSGNFNAQETSTSLKYEFDEGSNNYRLVISSGSQGEQVTTGDFRLLMGVNAPEVLVGSGEPVGRPVIYDPFEVKVGIQMDQIASVDQKAENYDVVANIIFSWRDPELAFNPDTCNCDSKVFTVSEFVDWTIDNDQLWPEFILFNQQGNRWSQNEIIQVQQDGQGSYFERFSVTLQAPDFDFRKFPFDSQDFYIRVQSLFSEELYFYQDLEGASKLGEQLGEEEWQVTDFDTIIDTVDNFGERSQFSFHFTAQRALTFYIIRIFIPLALIILVAWITFFLKNYTRRIEITVGNLLLFIAYNFTISDSLPKLGYLTFMDVLLVGTFIISVIVVAFNVYLRRLEVNGKEEIAQKVDQYTIWIYPLAFIVTFGSIYWYFFL